RCHEARTHRQLPTGTQAARHKPIVDHASQKRCAEGAADNVGGGSTFGPRRHAGKDRTPEIGGTWRGSTWNSVAATQRRRSRSAVVTPFARHSSGKSGNWCVGATRSSKLSR